MVKAPSQKELAAFVVGHGIVDFVSGGKLSLIERNAIWKALKKLGPATVSTTGRLASTAVTGAFRGAKFITMRHPYIAAAVVTYEVVKNRDQIAQLAQEGWSVVQDIAETRQEFIQQNPEQFIDLPFVGPVRPIGVFPTQKRRKSSYNTSVSKAMKAIKKSTSYGKKGIINTPKKAFGFVARTVSKLRRGKKVSSKGASGVVKRSLPGISKITVRK